MLCMNDNLQAELDVVCFNLETLCELFSEQLLILEKSDVQVMEELNESDLEEIKNTARDLYMSLLEEKLIKQK